MERRTLLLGTGASAMLPLPAAAAAAPIRFRVLREGRAIGSHAVRFADSPEGVQATTEVDIAVRLAGITVFRLTHRFEEVWAGDRLVRAASQYERNGRATRYQARAERGGILVEGSAGTFRVPADSAPLTWWDPRRLGGPLFDNETGRPLQLAWTRAAGPAGGVRWRCRDAANGEESEGGYAADGAWLDWRTKGEDGSVVTYERG